VVVIGRAPLIVLTAKEFIFARGTARSGGSDYSSGVELGPLDRRW
jgi:hypothetical protein